MVLICISLITTYVEHLFMYLLALCVSFVEKHVFRCFALWAILLLIAWVLYLFWILVPYQTDDLQLCSLLRRPSCLSLAAAFAMFSPPSFPGGCLCYVLSSGGCLVSPRRRPLLCRSFFICCHPVCFAFVAFVFRARLKKSSPSLMSRSLPPMFSSRNFMFSGLTFKCLIHFELIYLNGVR